MQDSDQRITALENRVRELEKKLRYYERHYFRNMMSRPMEKKEVINVSLTQEIWDRIDDSRSQIQPRNPSYPKAKWVIEELCWERVSKMYTPSEIKESASESAKFAKVEREIPIDPGVLRLLRSMASNEGINGTISDIIQYFCEQYLDMFIASERYYTGESYGSNSHVWFD